MIQNVPLLSPFMSDSQLRMIVQVHLHRFFINIYFVTQLTTARLASAPEYSTYCTLAVQSRTTECIGVRVICKSVYTYKASECKSTIIRLHCVTSKSSLWNMEYIARGGERPRIYRTSTNVSAF